MITMMKRKYLSMKCLKNPIDYLVHHMKHPILNRRIYKSTIFLGKISVYFLRARKNLGFLIKIKLHVLNNEFWQPLCSNYLCTVRNKWCLSPLGKTQYPFLSIFVQNCTKVNNMICDYFNFFLHFSYVHPTSTYYE